MYQKHPGEAGRPETFSEKDRAGVPKAAGRSVAVVETNSHRKEAVIPMVLEDGKGKERKGTLFKCLVVLALEH